MLLESVINIIKKNMIIDNINKIICSNRVKEFLLYFLNITVKILIKN